MHCPVSLTLLFCPWLQSGKVYDDVKQLRYGHVMIMADQDHDGSHIKGLFINFIHSFWPSLLQVRTHAASPPACLSRATVPALHADFATPAADAGLYA